MKIPRLKIVPFLALLAITALFVGAAHSQTLKGERPCTQLRAELDSLIDEAESGQFTIVQVNFWGNVFIHDRELRGEKQTLDEGDIFTRTALKTSIDRLSKMKSIYPITIDDIKIRLDRPRKDIDILFCVKERPKNNS